MAFKANSSNDVAVRRGVCDEPLRMPRILGMDGRANMDGSGMDVAVSRMGS